MLFVGRKKENFEEKLGCNKVNIFFRSGTTPDFPEHFTFEGNLPIQGMTRGTNAWVL